MPGTGRRRDGHQPWRLSQESSSRVISAVVPLHCLRHAGEAVSAPPDAIISPCPLDPLAHAMLRLTLSNRFEFLLESLLDRLAE
jgi:hypothetical protein